MPKNKETNNKNYIPGTNPAWGYEIPDGYSNSMTDESGRSVDTGWNYDEKDDELSDEEREMFKTYEKLADECPFDPEVARELARQADNRNSRLDEDDEDDEYDEYDDEVL